MHIKTTRENSNNTLSFITFANPEPPRVPLSGEEADKFLIERFKYKSLFDYLGYAAGPELGIEMHAYSTLKKVRVYYKNVVYSKYKEGRINLYPESLIKEFFLNKEFFTKK